MSERYPRIEHTVEMPLNPSSQPTFALRRGDIEAFSMWMFERGLTKPPAKPEFVVEALSAYLRDTKVRAQYDAWFDLSEKDSELVRAAATKLWRDAIRYRKNDVAIGLLSQGFVPATALEEGPDRHDLIASVRHVIEAGYIDYELLEQIVTTKGLPTEIQEVATAHLPKLLVRALKHSLYPTFLRLHPYVDPRNQPDQAALREAVLHSPEALKRDAETSMRIFQLCGLTREDISGELADDLFLLAARSGNDAVFDFFRSYEGERANKKYGRVDTAWKACAEAGAARCMKVMQRLGIEDAQDHEIVVKRALTDLFRNPNPRILEDIRAYLKPPRELEKAAASEAIIGIIDSTYESSITEPEIKFGARPHSAPLLVGDLERIRRDARLDAQTFRQSVEDGLKAIVSAFRYQDAERTQERIAVLRAFEDAIGLSPSSKANVRVYAAEQMIAADRPAFFQRIAPLEVGPEELREGARQHLLHAADPSSYRDLAESIVCVRNAGHSSVLADADVRNTCRAWIRGRLVKTTEYEDIHSVSDAIALSAEERMEDRAAVATEVRADWIQMIGHGGIETARAVATEFAFDWNSLTRAELPVSAFTERNFPEVDTQRTGDAWADSFKRLVKLQGRSANTENDPWITDFNALVQTLIEGNILDREKSADGILLEEFVRTFGMLRLPGIARAFILLKRGATFADLPSVVQEQLRGFRRHTATMNADQIINELRLARSSFVPELLVDRIPRTATTELGAELLMAMKGHTDWERDESFLNVVARYKETAAKHPERVRLPEYYASRRLMVPTIVSRPLAIRGATRFAEAQRDVQTEYATIWKPWKRELDALRALDRVDPRDDIAELVEKESPELAARIRSLAKPISWGDPSATYALLTELVAADARLSSATKESLLRILTLSHLSVMRLHGGTHMASATLDAFHETDERDPSTVASLAEHVVGFLGEHYLSDRHAGDGGPRLAVSPETLATLRRAWGFTAEGKHPLEGYQAALDAIDDEFQVVETGPPAPVLLSFSHGFLRVISGDIGDACYTSQHTELANGDYPNLHAGTFVLNPDSEKRRLAGSVLFIETATPTGERVLLVRANNPRQSLFAQVDSDALVEQTLAVAREIAEANGFDYVVVPRDRASSSSSNRPPVARYYQRKFRNAPKLKLVQSPETNFNGYDVWNDQSRHAAVVVWKRDKQEAALVA